MSTKWTENQNLAINARGGDVLVSAAAGSGKTAVLVERVIRMITDPVSPISIDRLLIVTYTRAAAAQLKERISLKLNELIQNEPDNRYLKRQLILLSRANISTVDSFCSEICREFFHKLDISKDYRIGETGELNVIRAAALDKTLDALYEEQDARFFELVRCFSNAKSDKGLGENIIKLYEFLCSHPFFDVWLNEKLSYYKDFDSVSESIWGKVSINFAKSISEYATTVCNKNIELAEKEPELFSLISNLILNDKAYFDRLNILLKNASWDEIREHVCTFENGKLLAKGYKDHPVKLSIAGNRNIIKSCAKELMGLFEFSEAQCIDDIKYLEPIVSSMFRSVSYFNKFYTEAKKNANIADFSDIEHWALDLLVKHNGETWSFTEEAKIVASRFDCVLVDEYQDANEVQDFIFRAVSSESNLFIVGDAKQSIYAFRQAMPEIFINRKNVYPLYSQEENNYPSKIILEKNFRTRKEITDVANFVFDRLMTEETGDISYKDGEGLVAGADYPRGNSPCVQFDLIEAGDASGEEKISLEAAYIASQIHKTILHTKIYEKGEERNCNFGDVAILLRSGKSKGALYAEELKKHGIPASFEGTTGYFDRDEIKLVLSILRVVDNPAQDIPLLATLMSPVFAFSSDDLAALRSTHRKGNLYSAILKSAADGNPKCKAFISEISSLRTLSVTMTAEDFINTLYERLGLVSVCACLVGDMGVSNLRLLAEYAANFEKGSAKGINAFVAYLDKLCQQECDLNPAQGEGDGILNAVRIMTVHSSKGLEFPVCILAGTSKRFKTDTSQNVLLHSSLGFAAKRRDKQTNCSYNTFVRKALAIEKKRSEMSEELRVLYVALTRAKEKLIVTATHKNIDSYIHSLASKLPCGDEVSPYIVSGVSSISDWLFMCALLHPQGNLLRSIANADDLEYAESSTMLDVNIVDSIEAEADCEKAEVVTEYEQADENISEIIKNRFSYVYPESVLCSLPQKVTASEIAHLDSKKIFSKILPKPAFLSEDKLTAAEKGTATHKFLQYCDFECAKNNPDKEAERLLNSGKLSKSELDAIDREKLSRFLNSKIIDDAIKYKSLREYRFSVNIPAYETGLVTKEDTNAQLVLQGAIDLVIIKDSKLTVVDYKTDRVKEVSELKERYKNQLRLYRLAASECLGLPVAECILYSIHLGEVTEV